MAKVTDIQDKNGVSKEVQDKDLSRQTAATAIASTDYVMLQDTSGGYHKIAKASFTEAVRSALGSVINSTAKGTDISKVPVLDSNNDLGMGTLANIASVLGVDYTGIFYRNGSSFTELFDISIINDVNALHSFVIELYTSDWQSPMCSTLYFTNDASSNMLYGVKNNIKFKTGGDGNIAPTFYLKKESGLLYRVYAEFSNNDTTQVNYKIRFSKGVSYSIVNTAATKDSSMIKIDTIDYLYQYPSLSSLASALGGLDLGLCYKEAIVVFDTSTPTKLTSTHFNQIFLVVGLSSTEENGDVLSIIFKQNTSNTISAVWNKGGNTISISDQTGYLNVTSQVINTTCMVLSNYPFTIG